MYNLIVTPDYDFINKDISDIKKLIRSLSKILDKQLNIILPKNYKEKMNTFKEIRPDLAYINPVLAQRLYIEGYIPYKLKKSHRLNLMILGNIKQEEDIVASLPYIESYFYTLLEVKELDLLRIKLIYTQTEAEAYELLKNGSVNIAIVSDTFYESLPQTERKDVDVYRVITSKIPHFLMISHEIQRKYGDLLAKLDDIKQIDSQDFRSYYKITLDFDSLVKVKGFYDIAKSVYQSPFIGTIIYNQHILYASEQVEKIFGYNLKEVKNINVENLFLHPEKEKIKEEIERRANGEVFISYYPDCKIITKSGEIKFVKVFIKTTLFEGDFASLMIVIDVTKEVKFQRMYKVLREVNQAITTVLTEEELFQKVCEALIKDLNIKFAWLGIYDEDGKIIERIFKCGIEENFLKSVNIHEGSKLDNGNIKPNYDVRTITISSDVRNLPDTKYRKDMLSREFMSKVTIPLLKFNNQVGILNIYSSEESFFDEDSKTILYEMQHDIRFALEKIDSIRNSILTTKALEKGKSWYMITDQDGKILYVNEYITKLTKYSKEELIGTKPNVFKSGYHDKKFYTKLWNKLNKNQEFEAIFINRTKDGKIFYLEQRIIPVVLGNRIKRYISIGKDITREAELFEENEKLRFYDKLTGLYNYTGFSIKVEEIIKSTGYGALLVIDINNFSYINKYYGVETGDSLLKKLAGLLVKNLGNSAVVGRVGGDEYGILLPRADEKDIYSTLDRLNLLLSSEIKIKEKNIKVGYNIGVSTYPSDARSFKELFQNATIALKESKTSTSNCYKFYNREIEKTVKDLIDKENLILNSLKQKKFVFFFQPYFSTEDEKVAGFEALVRIRREDGGIIPAGEFIDILENSIYVHQFQDMAIDYIRQRLKVFKHPISINISAKSFEDEKSFEKLLARTSKIKRPLTLEITERVFMSEINEKLDMIKKLRENKNIKIAIDDFGTGYSSLSYINDIQPDVLKIDISFIRRLPEDKKSRTLVQSIVHLCKFLGISTLAEGVETRAQLDILKYFGVDYVQGFHLSEPLEEGKALEIETGATS